nr:hypothetical protein [Marinicella sp. W31]MDC2876997.1 hypothetical protein [Marinicella sp. W31]
MRCLNMARIILLSGVCLSGTATFADTASPKTAAANALMLQQLDFSDRRDFEDATRGFIATFDPAIITDS